MELEKKFDARLNLQLKGGRDYLHGTDSAGKFTRLPVVVLLDLNMPRVNGLQVLQKMRSHDHTRTVPVVVLTTSDEQRDVIDDRRHQCGQHHLGVGNF